MKISIYISLFFFLFVSQTQAKVRLVGVDPIYKIISFKSYYTDTTDIRKFVVLSQGKLIRLDSMKLMAGNYLMPSKGFVFLSFPFLNYDSGSLTIYDLRYSKDTNASNFCDFIQWGKPNQENESYADSLGFWKKGDYIQTAPPYSFLGGSLDRGKSFWQSYKIPLFGLRMIDIYPSQNKVAIKNTGSSNIDISNLFFSNDTGLSDSISRSPFQVLKGKLNILKNDTVIIGGIELNDTAGSLGLFFNINKIDTANLVDYVKWGNQPCRYAWCPQSKNTWDTNQVIYIQTGDTLHYIGDYSRKQSGPSYWEIKTKKESVVDTTQQYIPSIQSALKIQIKQYGEEFYIHYMQPEPVVLNIYEPTGRLVHIKELLKGEHWIHVPVASNGVYFFVFNRGNQTSIERFLILKD